LAQRKTNRKHSRKLITFPKSRN